jgi:hypothetical protein
MPTKYAEWIYLDQDHDPRLCDCRILIDIGTVIEHDEDPNCKLHRERPCIVCGNLASASTISHGSLGRWDLHRPVFGGA